MTTLPLFNSLKKLFIPRWKEDIALSVQIVVWLLIFCPSLTEASLAFSFTTSDFDYLSEHASVLAGRSNVKRLALQFHALFRESDRSNWWGLSKETSQRWRGGNKKTATLILLLSILGNLTSLELCYSGGLENPGDHTYVSIQILGALARSFDSLRHLRLLGFGIGIDERGQFDDCVLRQFKRLRVLTLTGVLLSDLMATRKIGFPSSLEVMALPFHFFNSSQPLASQIDEEAVFLQFLKSSKMPRNVKQVIVPFRSISKTGNPIIDDPISNQFHQRWKNTREALEKAEICTSGKVKLRKLGLGENGEIYSRHLNGVSLPSFIFSHSPLFTLCFFVSSQSEILPKENCSCRLWDGSHLRRSDQAESCGLNWSFPSRKSNFFQDRLQLGNFPLQSGGSLPLLIFDHLSLSAFSFVSNTDSSFCSISRSQNFKSIAQITNNHTKLKRIVHWPSDQNNVARFHLTPKPEFSLCLSDVEVISLVLCNFMRFFRLMSWSLWKWIWRVKRE